jgi:hypothetical protein
MREIKPTRFPKTARLWATMVDDPPKVMTMSLATSSRSGASSAGSPYSKMSRFNSPAMTTSNFGIFGLLLFVLKNNHAAQVARPVRVKAFVQSSV